MKRPIAYVAGTGRGIPAKVMTNHDFAALGLETSHEWIVERTGIVERRIAAAGETTCSMAATASCQAMAKAGVHAGELDAIVLSTATPDRLLPSTAVELQAQLGDVLNRSFADNTNAWELKPSGEWERRSPGSQPPRNLQKELLALHTERFESRPPVPAA